MKYVLIRTDNTVEIVEISSENFLDECYKLINCSFIEIATPNCGRSPFRVVLDDIGKFNDQKLNRLATAFYSSPDILFGNVLVGRAGFNEYGEYDFIGFDDEIAKDLKFCLESAVPFLEKGLNVSFI